MLSGSGSGWGAEAPSHGWPCCTHVAVRERANELRSRDATVCTCVDATVCTCVGTVCTCRDATVCTRVDGIIHASPL
jgi:hypothetical protein